MKASLLILSLVAMVGGLWLPGVNDVFAAQAGGASLDNPCTGTDILLNTDIPFVGKCIKKSTDASVAGNNVTVSNAFPRLLGGLMRIALTAVVIIAFMGILVGGFMMSAGGINQSWVSGGRGLIIKVIMGLAVLGLSGILLNLINPNFFGTNSQPTSSP